MQIAELENSKRELETLLRVSQQELQGAEEAAERQRAETRRERAARNVSGYRRRCFQSPSAVLCMTGNDGVRCIFLMLVALHP